MKEKIQELERQIAALPIGYISKKTINGKTRYYHQWTENGKKHSQYLRDGELEPLQEQIEQRKVLRAQLKELQAKMPKVRQPKTEGVRTGEDDLHSHRRKHIGEESRRIDEIPHQGDLINEYIAEARIEQFFQIPVHHGHGIASAGFDIGRAAEILFAHSGDGLPEHGSLSGPA